MPSSRKTQHMGLNLWDENDYLTSHDLNADNQKIDDALAGQVTPPYIGTDGFWYVFDLSKKEYVKTAYPARGEKGAQGEPGAKGETGATGAKGDTGNPLHVAGSFDTLEQLQAAHPDGDGQNSYLVQGYVYVWNGMSWEKTNISGAGKYSDLPDKPSIGGVELTGDKSVHDIGAALSVDAFIPCVSAYDAAAKRHTLTPVQVGIVLPEVFTVRFMATAGFKAGDKVALAGVEYTSAYTDSDGAVETGVWQVDAEVILTCRTADKKVFVGKALENKADCLSGIWEPKLVGRGTAGNAVYTFRDATYTKIGKLVMVNIEQFNMTSKGGMVGDLIIKGIPFPIKKSSSGTFGTIRDLVSGINGYEFIPRAAMGLQCFCFGRYTGDRWLHEAQITDNFNFHAFTVIYQTD